MVVKWAQVQLPGLNKRPFYVASVVSPLVRVGFLPTVQKDAGLRSIRGSFLTPIMGLIKVHRITLLHILWFPPSKGPKHADLRQIGDSK